MLLIRQIYVDSWSKVCMLLERGLLKQCQENTQTTLPEEM